ncbi:MAG: DNA primase [Desulfatirhabdiaceae bacterium]|nr:DNA primase [Desulfatirhabdiaceae bacterium]
MSNSISADKISEIKHSADILEIISDAVTLKKAGRNFLGLCPFHSEKTPSFTVSPDKQMFYCFGCGEGGNVFTFVMKQEGIAFPEAVRFLARRYGIVIADQAMSPGLKKQVDERELLFQINRQAMEFFHHTLLNPKIGTPALSYLTRRGLPSSILTDFKLGYVQPGWSHLTDYFSQKGVALTLVEKAGLIGRRQSGSGYYDRFRDRIIFPIFNTHHQVAGFGGRVMDDSLPKYLNSPETPLYSKSRSLYGLFQAKPFCRQTGEVFIAEGYMDLLSLHFHGMQNSVATLGTAMTEEHIRLLKGVSQKITLVYDSDQAGIKAAQRCIALFKAHHQLEDIRILVLPEGHDPDSYLQQFGPESFRNAANQASGVFSFLMDVAIKKHGLSLEGKLRIIQEMEEPLSTLTDGLTRISAIKEIAERTGIDESAIQEKIRENSPRRPFRAKPAEKSPDAGNKFEKRLIAMMLQFPEVIPVLIEKNLIEYISDPLLKSTGNDILSCYRDLDNAPEQINDLPSIALMAADNDEKKRLIAAFSIQKDEWDLEGCRKLIGQIERNQKRDNLRMLRQRMKAAEESGEQELLRKLTKECSDGQVSAGGR